MVDRSRLISYLDYSFRPPAWFYAQIETAIEHAAEGRNDVVAELDMRRCRVHAIVEDYQLDELVEEVRNPTPEQDDAFYRTTKGDC